MTSGYTFDTFYTSFLAFPWNQTHDFGDGSFTGQKIIYQEDVQHCLAKTRENRPSPVNTKCSNRSRHSPVTVLRQGTELLLFSFDLMHADCYTNGINKDKITILKHWLFIFLICLAMSLPPALHYGTCGWVAFPLLGMPCKLIATFWEAKKTMIIEIWPSAIFKCLIEIATHPVQPRLAR